MEIISLNRKKKKKMEFLEKPVKATNGSRPSIVNTDVIEEPNKLDINEPFNKTREITQNQERKRIYRTSS